eukprot:RCo045243
MMMTTNGAAPVWGGMATEAYAPAHHPPMGYVPTTSTRVLGDRQVNVAMLETMPRAMIPGIAGCQPGPATQQQGSHHHQSHHHKKGASDHKPFSALLGIFKKKKGKKGELPQPAPQLQPQPQLQHPSQPQQPQPLQPRPNQQQQQQQPRQPVQQPPSSAPGYSAPP